MNHYVKSVEEQNEELRQKLAESESYNAKLENENNRLAAWQRDCVQWQGPILSLIGDPQPVDKGALSSDEMVIIGKGTATAYEGIKKILADSLNGNDDFIIQPRISFDNNGDWHCDVIVRKKHNAKFK